eukprot:2196032-Alexandrium_andersonii.AAC.1
MSASLVGSEMCIRDRHLVLEPYTSISVKSMLAAPTATVALSALALTISVSYTHLTLPTICSV